MSFHDELRVEEFGYVHVLNEYSLQEMRNASVRCDQGEGVTLELVVAVGRALSNDLNDWGLPIASGALLKARCDLVVSRCTYNEADGGYESFTFFGLIGRQPARFTYTFGYGKSRCALSEPGSHMAARLLG